MKDMWRFYDGSVSGFVKATNYKQAIDRTNDYLNAHFYNGGIAESKIQVWKCIEDVDYDPCCPFAIAVSY